MPEDNIGVMRRMKHTLTNRLLVAVISIGVCSGATIAEAQFWPFSNKPTPAPTRPAVSATAAPTPRTTATPVPTIRPTVTPLPTISSRDANTGDVAMCTSLAAAISTLAWNAGALGAGATWANTTVAQLINMNPNTLAGLQLLAGALGYPMMPDDWMELTLEQLFAFTIKPGWDSCKLIVSNFTELPATFAILTAEPTFWVPQPNDSPGIAMGRSCAEQWRGGRASQSLTACMLCCEENLTNTSRQLSCKAVCQAQFSKPKVSWGF